MNTTRGLAERSNSIQIIMPTGQSREGRLWNVLMVLLFKIKEGSGEDNIILFQVAFQMKEGMIDVTLRAEIGPGDNMEPVMTIGLPSAF